jgi:hypothetical protein
MMILNQIRAKPASMQLSLIVCLIVAFFIYATRYVWLSERVTQDELFVHSLRLKLSTLSGQLGNCTAIVDAVLDEKSTAAAAARVAVDRAFIDACVAQGHELTETIHVLQAKLTQQTTLVHELRDEIDRLRHAPAAAVDATGSQAELIRNLQHELTSLRNAAASPAAVGEDVKHLQQLIAQRDFLSQCVGRNCAA